MSVQTMVRDGRLAFAATCAAGAIAYLSIGLARGEPGFAIFGFAIMAGYGALLLALRRRSEPFALLSGKPADERQAQVMLRASAFTAHVLVVVLVAAALITLAAGSRYAGMFCGLCAVAGVSFGAATVWYARRG